jgi:probable HAF family extracellular repeat protein
MIALPPLVPPLPKGGGNNFVASGANDQEIIGFAENGVKDPECKKHKGSTQVFRFEGVVWTLGSDGEPFVSRRLPPYGNDTVSVAGGINEIGDIVGTSGLCAPPQGGFGIGNHAVLWKKDGSVIDLGNLGGTTNNVAAAINNLGQVVGNSDLVVGGSDLGVHAFLWEEGSGMQDLGTLPGDVYSGASAINDSGEVVGVSCNSATGNCRSFHWQRGVMTDISALPAVSNLVGVTANDINSLGEIAIAANDTKISDPNDPTGFLQIAAVLIPAGLAPAPIPAHSTGPNADALVSALAGAKPSTSIAAPQSCGVIGASCASGQRCCAGELCGRRHTCCNAPFKDDYCTSYSDCCDGLGCLNHRCL